MFGIFKFWKSIDFGIFGMLDSDVSRRCLEAIQKLSRRYSKAIQEVSRRYPEAIQKEATRGVLGDIGGVLLNMYFYVRGGHRL